MQKVRWSALAMGALYVGAGVLHFAVTQLYMRAMPEYLPAPHALVLVSGAAEIAGGVGVFIYDIQERVEGLKGWPVGPSPDR